MLTNSTFLEKKVWKGHQLLTPFTRFLKIFLATIGTGGCTMSGGPLKTNFHMFYYKLWRFQRCLKAFRSNLNPKLSKIEDNWHQTLLRTLGLSACPRSERVTQPHTQHTQGPIALPKLRSRYPRSDCVTQAPVPIPKVRLRYPTSHLGYLRSERVTQGLNVPKVSKYPRYVPKVSLPSLFEWP